MNREKNVPIVKVRIFASVTVTTFDLKEHRDLSEKEYKRQYHVVNDGNYCVAYYGETKPSFKVFSMMDVACHFRNGGTMKDLVPSSDESGRELTRVVKIGAMILFYENTPEEVYECSRQDMAKRLYKVTGIADKGKYVYLTVKHHQEASPSSELKITTGLWKINDCYRPIIVVSQHQCRFLVEGLDFKLSLSGDIVFNR